MSNFVWSYRQARDFEIIWTSADYGKQIDSNNNQVVGNHMKYNKNLQACCLQKRTLFVRAQGRDGVWLSAGP